MLFVCLQHEFVKNANLISVGMRGTFSAELVWRLSGFAFLCGCFGSRTF